MENDQDDAHDLPDDDSLIAFIGEQPEPPKIKEIAKAFGIRADGRAALRKRLRQLADTGQIKTLEGRRLAAPDQLPPVTVLDVIAITDDGDALATAGEAAVSTAAEILLIADKRRGKALAVGDRVLARLQRVGPDSYEGHVIRKLDRHRQRLFGLVFTRNDGYHVEPVERGAKAPLMLVPPPPGTAIANGDMVEVELVRSSGYGAKKAKLLHNLGPADAPGAFSTLAIAEFELRHVFSDSTLAEAAAAQKPVLGTREDLRAIPLVTIDGADARDFDDAVFAAPLEDGGHRLIVAIADVAHYVSLDSSLDREARKRGNSVYLPDRVLPMLPEALSNGSARSCPVKTGPALPLKLRSAPMAANAATGFCAG